MTAVLTGHPHGQTETGAAYASHAQGRAIAPADITVGMTISIHPGENPITVYRVEDGEYFRWVYDGRNKPHAIYPDAWCAVVTA